MTKAILFIDDEPYYADPLVEALQRAHYEVVFESQAKEGLKRLREQPERFGLVILDYMMPPPPGLSEAETLDGLATGRWLLRQAWPAIVAHDLRVLVLTNREPLSLPSELPEVDAAEVEKRVRLRTKRHTLMRDVAGVVAELIR